MNHLRHNSVFWQAGTPHHLSKGGRDCLTSVKVLSLMWWDQLMLWHNHKIQTAAEAVRPNSNGQGLPDLTGQAGQEKYHQTIPFMLDLISNILTILAALIRKSRAWVCIH